MTAQRIPLRPSDQKHGCSKKQDFQCRYDFCIRCHHLYIKLCRQFQTTVSCQESADIKAMDKSLSFFSQHSKITKQAQKQKCNHSCHKLCDHTASITRKRNCICKKKRCHIHTSKKNRYNQYRNEYRNHLRHSHKFLFHVLLPFN